MDYLYGEMPAADQRAAERHLQQCPECARRVERWQATMGLLDTDRATLVRPGRGRWAVFAAPAVRLALAASVVLVAGILAGRATGLSRDDLAREIAIARGQIEADLARKRSEELQSMAAATVAAATEQNRAYFAELGQQLNSARAEERRDWLAALDTLNRQHAADLAAVKAGLATLAHRTGVGFQQAESQLNLLASYLPADTEFPGGTDSSQNKINP